VCYARILDLKRKFLEAALRYYDISQIEKRQIEDEYVKLGFIYCECLVHLVFTLILCGILRM
jgi:hypothetical protein